MPANIDTGCFARDGTAESAKPLNRRTRGRPGRRATGIASRLGCPPIHDRTTARASIGPFSQNLAAIRLVELGWHKDKYGLSWQVVPTLATERPAARPLQSSFPE